MGVSKNPKISDQDTAIAKIYDSLVHDLGEGQAATRGIFARGNQAMAGAYQGASDALRGSQGAMTQRLTASLGGLGLGAALPEVMAPMNEQFAFDQGQIAKTRGTDLGTLARQGTQYEAIGQTGIGNAQKEKAQTRVSAMEKLQAVLADLEAARIEAEGRVEEKRLENQIRLAEARRASSGGGGSIDPLDALRAEKMGLEIQGMQNDLSNPGWDKEQKFATGQRGLHEFLNSPTAYWGQSADPATRARIENIINTTAKRTGLAAFTSGGNKYLTENMDPLQIALIGAGNTKESRINKEALRMALELYYGR